MLRISSSRPLLSFKGDISDDEVGLEGLDGSHGAGSIFFLFFLSSFPLGRKPIMSVLAIEDLGGRCRTKPPANGHPPGVPIFPSIALVTVAFLFFGWCALSFCSFAPRAVEANA